MGYLIHPVYFRTNVVTAPSPATTGTTLEVTSGEGASLSVPSTAQVFSAGADFNQHDLGEQVRITGASGDTLTIQRQASLHAARSIQVGDDVYVRAPEGALATAPSESGGTVLGQLTRGVGFSGFQNYFTLAVGPTPTLAVFEATSYSEQISLNEAQDTFTFAVDGRYLLTAQCYVDQHATDWAGLLVGTFGGFWTNLPVPPVTLIDLTASGMNAVAAAIFEFALGDTFSLGLRTVGASLGIQPTLQIQYLGSRRGLSTLTGQP